jgi:uncharacterized membrane protein
MRIEALKQSNTEGRKEGRKRLPEAEFLFLFLGSIFGLLSIIFTPPFQSPDEISHFFRAYQISEGHYLGMHSNNRVGGYVPVSLVALADRFMPLTYDLHSRTSFAGIIEAGKIPLNKKHRAFADFPNTAIYPAPAYLPQALTILLLRQIDAGPLLMFYLTRLSSLIFWLMIVFLSLRALDDLKLLVALISLLPMAVFINSSISADVMVNGLSLAYIALVVRIASSDEKIRAGRFILLILIALTLASLKIVYAPLIGLALLIRPSRFPSVKYYVLGMSMLITLSGLAAGLAYTSAKPLYLEYSRYNQKFRDQATLVECADIDRQMDHILSDEKDFLLVSMHSMKEAFPMYSRGIIGTLGWLDTFIPLWFIYASYVLIFLVTLKSRIPPQFSGWWARLVLFGIIILSVLLILISQHLIWDCPGSPAIQNLQGRYFLPLLPLVFLLIKPGTLRIPQGSSHILLSYALLSTMITVIALNKRYYVLPVFSETNCICDTERVGPDNTFQTSNPEISLGNGNTQTQLAARSGRHSAMLNLSDQYAYAYLFTRCKPGDIVEVEVWRKGNGGQLVIAGDNNRYYISRTWPVIKDASVWQKIGCREVIPREFRGTEVAVFLFNDEPDTTYFDDYRITYSRLK